MTEPYPPDDAKPGDRRILRTELMNMSHWAFAWEARGWQFISAQGFPRTARGLPPMGEVTMEYVGHD